MTIPASAYGPGGNYPAGAFSDPRAPWNQPDGIEEECGECKGTGRYLICEECGSANELPCPESGSYWEPCDDCSGDGFTVHYCDSHCERHCGCRNCNYDG